MLMRIFILLCFTCLLACSPDTGTANTGRNKTFQYPDSVSVIEDSTIYINGNIPLKEIITKAGYKKQKGWIHIDKSNLILSYMQDKTIVKQFPVVLGGNPVDDKRREGDQCTPEGWFSIRALYPHRSWSYFMWIDYPTKESWSKHKTSKQKGEIPQNATIGGEVGIHGVPEGYNTLVEEKIHWTLGCISLKTEHIKELYAYSFQGMKVFIEP
jgi:murein L,D-transpeptidase YafK